MSKPITIEQLRRVVSKITGSVPAKRVWADMKDRQLLWFLVEELEEDAAQEAPSESAEAIALLQATLARITADRDADRREVARLSAALRRIATGGCRYDQNRPHTEDMCPACIAWKTLGVG